MKGSHIKIRWIPTQNTLLHIILIKKGCFYINISTNIWISKKTPLCRGVHYKKEWCKLSNLSTLFW